MRALAAVLCLLTSAGVAQEVPAGYAMDTIPHLPRLLWDDGAALARAPGAWGPSQWSQAALGVAAVAGAGLVLDRDLDRAVVRNRRASWDQPAKDAAQLGGIGGLALVGGGYLATSLLGRDEARAMWVDAGLATVLARTVAFTGQLAVGRARPGEDRGTHDFRPFSSADSFPSGHAAQAFAIASAVSLHADNPWVGAAAYGLAGLVGLSRLETRDHFSSDVVAGALVGTVIGRAVVPLNQRRRQGAGSRAQVSFSPVLDGSFRGVRLVAAF